MKNLFTALLILVAQFSFAEHCMLYEVSLENRVNISSEIFEGKVLASEAIRLENGNIYTVHEIEVYKHFKGDETKSIFSIATPGGMIGNEMHVIRPSLELKQGDVGIFFLKGDLLNGKYYEPYAGPQGFIPFDVTKNEAYDAFATYNSISEELYGLIIGLTGQQPDVLHKIQFGAKSGKSSAGPITSISPSSITAGTKSILTITGTNFGVSRGVGSVLFESSSTGPPTVEALPSEYVSWTDTEIQVHVPSGAGTGDVVVSKAGTFTSPTELKIDFAQLNVFTTSNLAFQVAHINDNGDGGYDWRMNNDLDGNNAAKNSFIRAFEKWREATCVNWELIEPTSIDNTTRDGTNIIRIGDSGELPNGVLAVTSSYYSSCSGGTVWYTDEIDLTYNDDVNWNFGQGTPAFNRFDFESVTIHELGHAHQLGHVIDEGDIMHRAIGPGDLKRNLTTSNVAAGNFVQVQSTTANSCGPSAMTNFPGCTSTVGVDSNNDLQINIELYPNPANDFLNINWISNSNKAAELRMMDLSGKLVREEYINKGLNTLSLTDVPQGMYLIEVRNNDQKYFSKVLIAN